MLVSSFPRVCQVHQVRLGEIQLQCLQPNVVINFYACLKMSVKVSFRDKLCCSCSICKAWSWSENCAWGCNWLFRSFRLRGSVICAKFSTNRWNTFHRPSEEPSFVMVNGSCTMKIVFIVCELTSRHPSLMTSPR